MGVRGSPTIVMHMGPGTMLMMMMVVMTMLVLLGVFMFLPFEP
jgi:hypothetical protein